MIAPIEIANQEILFELLTCKICKGILRSPVQCAKCGNTYCSICFNNKKKCLNNCSIVPSSAPWLNNIILSLKFKCKNGCGKLIDYNEYEFHYLMNCPNVDYKATIPKLIEKVTLMKIKADELKIVNKKLKANNEKNNKKDSQHYIELIKTHKRWKNEQQHLSIIQSQLNRAMNNNGSNPMNFTNHFGNAGYGNFNNVFNSYRRGDSDEDFLAHIENVRRETAQLQGEINNYYQRYGVQNPA